MVPTSHGTADQSRSVGRRSTAAGATAAARRTTASQRAHRPLRPLQRFRRRSCQSPHDDINADHRADCCADHRVFNFTRADRHANRRVFARVDHRADRRRANRRDNHRADSPRLRQRRPLRLHQRRPPRHHYTGSRADCRADRRAAAPTPSADVRADCRTRADRLPDVCAPTILLGLRRCSSAAVSARSDTDGRAHAPPPPLGARGLLERPSRPLLSRGDGVATAAWEMDCSGGASSRGTTGDNRRVSAALRFCEATHSASASPLRASAAASIAIASRRPPPRSRRRRRRRRRRHRHGTAAATVAPPPPRSRHHRRHGRAAVIVTRLSSVRAQAVPPLVRNHQPPDRPRGQHRVAFAQTAAAAATPTTWRQRRRGAAVVAVAYPRHAPRRARPSARPSARTSAQPLACTRRRGGQCGCGSRRR